MLCYVCKRNSRNQNETLNARFTVAATTAATRGTNTIVELLLIEVKVKSAMNQL